MTHQPNETKPMTFKRLTDEELAETNSKIVTLRGDLQFDIINRLLDELPRYVTALQSAYAEIDRLNQKLDEETAGVTNDAHTIAAIKAEIGRLSDALSAEKDMVDSLGGKTDEQAAVIEDQQIEIVKGLELLSSAKEMAEFYGNFKLYRDDVGNRAFWDSTIDKDRGRCSRAWLEELKKYEEGK